MKIEEVFEQIKEEHQFAITHFPPFASAHEGIAIIREEYLELEAEIFKHQRIRSVEKMHHEAVQLATMAIRFIIDLDKERDE